MRNLTAPVLFLTAIFAAPSHGQTTQNPQDVPPTAQTEPTSVPTEPAPEEPRRRFRLGVDVGAFFPTSSRTRDRFGGSWLSIGPGFGIVRRASRRGRVALDLDIMSQKKNGNRALVIPIGASYIRALGDPAENRSTLPYIGASLLAIPARLRSLPDGIDSGLKVGAGAAAFVGTTFGGRGFIEARYMATTRVESFSLSGASLRAGVRF